MAWKEDLTTAAILVAGGAIGGLLGLGVYGHLRNKGWSTWKAGAASGALGGALGATVGILGKRVGFLSGIGQLPRAYPTPWRLVPKHVAGVAMKGVCGACR